MIIGNAEPIKNEIIQLQLLICGMNFLPAGDKVLHVQARAAHETFVWGINKVWLINSGSQCGVHGKQVRNGPFFEGKHWEKR